MSPDRAEVGVTGVNKVVACPCSTLLTSGRGIRVPCDFDVGYRGLAHWTSSARLSWRWSLLNSILFVPLNSHSWGSTVFRVVAHVRKKTFCLSNKNGQFIHKACEESGVSLTFLCIYLNITQHNYRLSNMLRLLTTENCHVDAHLPCSCSPGSCKFKTKTAIWPDEVDGSVSDPSLVSVQAWSSKSLTADHGMNKGLNIGNEEFCQTSWKKRLEMKDCCWKCCDA